MSEVIVERDGGRVSLTLNRPAKRNALSAELVEQLREQVLDAYDTDTHLLVIRGEGKCFSAGFDFGEVDTESDGDLMRRFVRIEELLQAVYHAPFTTMALAHGATFGAGADLVCACAHRIGSAATTFRMPGLRFGIVLGTRRLAERVGTTTAARMQSESAVVGAEEGLRTGLLTALAEPGEWQERAAEVERDAAVPGSTARWAFHRALAEHTGDSDLADLVRSAAVPGLRQRIQSYREGDRRDRT